MTLPSISTMLESNFASAVETSIGAALLIGFGLLLFAIFPNLFGPRWRFIFGAIVLTRLLLPISPESRFSIFNLWSPTTATVEERKLVQVSYSSFEWSTGTVKPASLLQPDSLPPIPFEKDPVISIHPEPASAVPHSNDSLNPAFLLPIAWFAGALGLMVASLVRFIRLRSWIHRHSIPVDDPRLHHLLDQCRRMLAVRKVISLETAPGLAGAAIFGWRQPRLLVAEDFVADFSESEIRGIFLHELAHVRRHDVFWNWLSHIALAVHWFNPLVWLACRRFRADREQICDAIALSHLSPRQKQQYGQTLLSAIRSWSRPSPAPFPAPALAPFFTRKSEIRNRIAMITRKEKSTPWILHALAVLAVAAAGAITFTSAVADNEERKEREERREVDRKDRDRPAPGSRETRHDGDREEPATRNQRREETIRKTIRTRDGDADPPAPPRGERDQPEARRGAPPRDGDRPPPPPGRRGPQPPQPGLPPEVREFSEQVQRLQKEVHELIRAGKREQAEEVEHEIHNLLKERPEMAEQFRNMQRHRENIEIGNRQRELHGALEKAMREGNEDEAQEIRREIEKIHHAVARRDAGEQGDQRIHHLHQAAENLERAGMGDEARRVREHAERLENEMRHRGGEHHNEELARHAEHLEREVGELREIVGDLREEVERLQDELRKARGDRD